MANIVPQCNQLLCYIDGKILHENIEEFNLPDLEILAIDADARILPLDVELKVRGEGREILAAVGRAAGKPNLQLEIRASIKHNYGETVPASWKCRGLPMNIPTPFMPPTMTLNLNAPFIPTTTLKLNAHVYEHIIDGEEKYYIDILKGIRRVDGVDHRKKSRELIGLDY